MLQTENFGTLTTAEQIREVLHEHKVFFDEDAPQVYCGTYGKYNAGSLGGMWVDLTRFDSYEEFLEFCRIVHHDEDDPEFMFQDFQNFPSCLYDEGGMGEETFEKILEYAKGDTEMYDAYYDCTGDLDLAAAEEQFRGHYDSEEDFAREMFYECYDTRAIPDEILNYMDFEAFARDLFLCDYRFSDGYVFSAY